MDGQNSPPRPYLNQLSFFAQSATANQALSKSRFVSKNRKAYTHYLFYFNLFIRLLQESTPHLERSREVGGCASLFYLQPQVQPVSHWQQ